MMSSLGIDFGTCTSVFAYAEPMRLQVLQDDEGEDIIPSVVAFTPHGKTQIGKSARGRMLIDPANTLHSVKRILGKSWPSPDVAAFRRQYPFELERDKDGYPRFVTRAGKLTAVQVSEFFLAHARAFSSITSKAIGQIVIAIPESADARQRDATLSAATQAGFLDAEVISEPAAATLAYLWQESASRMLLVYDFGGGTFDAAVVRWDKGCPRIQSTAGDSYLGGDDLDHKLTDWACSEILSQFRWDVTTNTKSRQVLRFICEQAKVRLSITDETSINLSPVDEVLRDKTLSIKRELLNELVKPLIDRTLAICDNATNLVGVLPKDLDGILMVGGMTFLPIVRHRVREHFGSQLLTTLPANRVVAMGAAVMGLESARNGR
ncbi:MAG: hypothetical protein A2289_02985 [Deltaproteobacteria bacterium RIFOXYA12_FULL_58_15]|nr:MAG: hypothetical protein A2289_02985 [Deltaproteobacteria bacterium RIFOXYA12_FULL_58_15]